MLCKTVLDRLSSRSTNRDAVGSLLGLYLTSKVSKEAVIPAVHDVKKLNLCRRRRKRCGTIETGLINGGGGRTVDGSWAVLARRPEIGPPSGRGLGYVPNFEISGPPQYLCIG